MLVRYSAIYALARGVPGIVNFVALALFTRLLVPAQYGTYVLIITWIGIANAVLFQWLRSSARRFQATYISQPEILRSSLAAGYVVMLGFATIVTSGIFLATGDHVLRQLLPFALLLLAVQALFELGLELVLAGFKPWRYGLLALVKSVVALVIGGTLAYLGLGALGVVVGSILGFLVPDVFMSRMEWKGILPSFQHESLSGPPRVRRSTLGDFRP